MKLKMAGKDYGFGKSTVLGLTNQACQRCGEKMPTGNGLVGAVCPSCKEVGATESMIRRVLSGESALGVVDEVLGGRDVEQEPAD